MCRKWNHIHILVVCACRKRRRHCFNVSWSSSSTFVAHWDAGRRCRHIVDRMVTDSVGHGSGVQGDSYRRLPHQEAGKCRHQKTLVSQKLFPALVLDVFFKRLIHRLIQRRKQEIRISIVSEERDQWLIFIKVIVMTARFWQFLYVNLCLQKALEALMIILAALELLYLLATHAGAVTHEGYANAPATKRTTTV